MSQTHSAIVWSRTNNEARMHVQYDTDPNFSHPITDQVMQIVNKTTDFSGHMKIEGLRDIHRIIIEYGSLTQMKEILIGQKINLRIG